MTSDKCPDGAEAPEPKKKRFAAPDIDSFKACCLGKRTENEHSKLKVTMDYKNGGYKFYLTRPVS